MVGRIRFKVQSFESETVLNGILLPLAGPEIYSFPIRPLSERVSVGGGVFFFVLLPFLAERIDEDNFSSFCPLTFRTGVVLTPGWPSFSKVRSESQPQHFL